jgi:antitoxin (DNA-binding transcriptional repressor) of toxin-antitoxin stability system
MKITASKLRENIYSVLDEAIRTGQTVDIVRKGQIVRLVPPRKRSKLSRLRKRPCLLCDPQEIVETDWSSEWSEAR